MVEALRSEAVNVLPSSGNTLRKWCLIRFQATRTEVRHNLHCAKSKIHISSDQWSSPNGHAFLGIVAHWWDLDDALKSALIALPKLLGVHSGENIAFTTVEVLKQYEIQNNVGYFMFDNASNNDTAVEHINQLLADLGIHRGMSDEECRLRCAGHILNLVVKALLFGKDSDSLEMDAVDFKTWRKVGALGKLHNICRFIRASPQRCEKFLNVQLDETDAFMLRLNNDTRWDSTYEMIDRALQLRGPVDAFVVAAMNKRGGETKKEHREQLAADQLKSADWKELEELHALLKPFKSITMELQGNLSDGRMNGAIFDVLPSFDYLLQHLEDAKKKFTGKSTIATCINLAWTKLNEYYEKSDLTSVYVIATMLDPREVRVL